MIEEGRVDPIGDELPPPPPDPAEEAARREAEEARARAPFVVGVVTVPRVAGRRRIPVRGRFADWGGTDEEGDTEDEELGVDFDDVSDT